MDYIATGNGRVSHIVSSVVPGPEGRKVVTVCGQSYDEHDIRVDNSIEVCAKCTGKEEKIVESLVDTVLPVPVQLEDDEDKPKSSKK